MATARYFVPGRKEAFFRLGPRERSQPPRRKDAGPHPQIRRVIRSEWMKAIWCAVAAGIVAGAAIQSVRAQASKQEPKAKPTITSGKQVAKGVGIPGSVFHNVDLSSSTFENVNMSRTRMHD